jgi:hypothetical protein
LRILDFHPTAVRRAVEAQVTLVACLAIACSGAQSSEPSASDLPPAVRVEFRQALLGPMKVGGAPWDGPGAVQPETVNAVTLALGAVNPQAELLALFANPAIAALDKPEPYGEARVVIAGSPIVVVKIDGAERDTLTPIWTTVALDRVPLQPDVRVEVTLYDRDLVNDDPMGAATITQQDLIAALQAGRIHHVRVAEQTNQQVLFLDISVYATQ